MKALKCIFTIIFATAIIFNFASNALAYQDNLVLSTGSVSESDELFAEQLALNNSHGDSEGGGVYVTSVNNPETGGESTVYLLSSMTLLSCVIVLARR